MANAGKMWTDEELISFGGNYFRSPWMRSVAVIARLLFTAADFYRWSAKPGPAARRDFSCTELSLQELGADRLELSIRMQPGYEPCREFFLVTKGVLAHMPTIVGMESAMVVMTEIKDGARYMIQVPSGGGMLAWLRKAVTWPFTARAAGQELRQAFEGLQQRYVELERQIFEREQAEKKLKAATDEMQAIFDAFPDLLFRVDRTGTILDYRAGRKSDLYLPSDQFLHKQIAEILPSDVGRLLTDSLNQAFEQNALVRVEYSLPLAAGTQYFEGRLIPLSDEQAIYIARNISELKQVEQALRDSEAQLNAAQERAQLGSWEFDPVSGQGSWSRQMYHLYGRDPALGMPSMEEFYALIHPDDRERVIAAQHDTLKTRASGITDYRTNPAKGPIRHLWATTHTIEDETGRITHLAGTAMDVTERKEAEIALHESEERYRLLFAAARDAIVIFEAESRRIVDMNESALSLYGYSRAELLELAGLDLSAAPEVSKAVIRQLSNQQVNLNLNEHKKKDGTIFPVEIAAGTFMLRGRTMIHAMIRDISDRKQAEQALKAYSERLEEMVEERTQELQAAHDRLIRQEKLATIGQMSASIAHELRNPLGAIKLSAFYLNRLRQRNTLKADNPKVKEHLSLIEGEIGVADRVISELLEMTRVKPLQEELVDLQGIMQDAAQRGMLSNRIELEFDLEPDPFRIWADRFQIRQVFINLLTNASQACSEDGRVIIAACLCSDQALAQILVRDNGHGIAPDNMAKVFEPLYTTKAKGTGLGLSICKQVVEMHGGSITLDSHLNRGTTVQLLLPTEPRQQRDV